MKPACHKKITASVIDLYLATRQDAFARQISQFREAVIKGSVDADTKPLNIRATNWHFFKENDRLEPIKVKVLDLMPIAFYPTSDHIFLHLVADLKKEIGKVVSHDVFNIVGRLLHHTQDMSTPAHVVPVFHGLDIVDIVEDSVNVKDSFEEFSSDVIDDVLAGITKKELATATLSNGNSTGLFDNYNHAAKQTLKDLYDSPLSRVKCRIDGADKTIGLDYFWKKNNPVLEDEESRRGFGHYGILGKHFGQIRIAISGKLYEILADDYMTIYRYLIHKMVQDSTLALLIVRGMIPENCK